MMNWLNIFCNSKKTKFLIKPAHISAFTQPKYSTPRALSAETYSPKQTYNEVTPTCIDVNRVGGHPLFE